MIAFVFLSFSLLTVYLIVLKNLNRHIFSVLRVISKQMSQYCFSEFVASCGCCCGCLI